MLFVSLGIDQNRIGLTVHSQDYRTSRTTNLVQYLACFAFQFGYRTNVFDQIHNHNIAHYLMPNTASNSAPSARIFGQRWDYSYHRRQLPAMLRRLLTRERRAFP